MHFLYSVTLSSIGLTFNGYFIFYRIKNITFVNINTHQQDSKYWESLKYWKTCLGHIGQLKFFKILIFT